MTIPTTYAALKTEIEAWTKRSDTDVTGRIDVFISMAESAMNAKLRTLAMEATESITLSSGNSYASLPSRFLEPISLCYSDGDTLMQLSRQELDTRAALNSTETGQPTYFAYASGRINFDITADSNYTLTLRYVKKLDLATDLSNDVLSAAPFAYLYGALVAFYRFVEDGAKVGEYMALFQAELQGLQDGDRASRGDATLRTDVYLMTS